MKHLESSTNLQVMSLRKGVHDVATSTVIGAWPPGSGDGDQGHSSSGEQLGGVSAGAGQGGETRGPGPQFHTHQQGGFEGQRVRKRRMKNRRNPEDSNGSSWFSKAAWLFGGAVVSAFAVDWYHKTFTRKPQSEEAEQPPMSLPGQVPNISGGFPQIVPMPLPMPMYPPQQPQAQMQKIEIDDDEKEFRSLLREAMKSKKNREARLEALLDDLE